jgi:cytochrome bd-type quinol oxidase subunit 2
MNTILTTVLMLMLTSLFFKAEAFHFSSSSRQLYKSHRDFMMTAPSVLVYKTPESLGSALCQDIKEAAVSRIKQKGSFYLAVPGGSVLKLVP